MPNPVSIDELTRRRDSLREALTEVGDVRPGTLVKITRKCSKPTCRCARPDDPGHPGWALMRQVKRKTVTRGVPSKALEQTRVQIAEYKRFRVLSREFVEASEALCRARLKAGRGAGRVAQKGGSARS